MSVNQGIMAASAGANYVSFFWGRIRDGVNEKYDKEREEAEKIGALDLDDFNPSRVVGMSRAIFSEQFPKVKIIVGSIRQAKDVRDATLAGAHIVTVPPKFLKSMLQHFKTDEVVGQFFADFRNWLS